MVMTQKRMTAVAVPATSRQLWALFCLTKEDHRGQGLTLEEASRLIDETKRGKIQKVAGFEILYQQAHAAGMVAALAKTPVPMVVQQHRRVLDDNSPVVKSWKVDSGICGFAWVKIRPATTAFARWLVKEGKGKVSNYEGGVTIWASGFGQSYERKMAYAGAFAQVLGKAGINAYPAGRLD